MTVKLIVTKAEHIIYVLCASLSFSVSCPLLNFGGKITHFNPFLAALSLCLLAAFMQKRGNFSKF